MSRPEYSHGAFGMTVLCNRRLPALPPARADASRTIRVDVPDGGVTLLGAPTGPPAFAEGVVRQWPMEDGGWLLRYAAVESARGGEWAMRIGGGGVRIDVERAAGAPVDDPLQVVQTAGLSAALQLAGAVVLHGCAIEFGNRAIIVVGPSGVGKSTTAAACVAAGHALLSDDIAAIDVVEGEPVVHAGLTQLRVTPRTAHAVGWDPERLPRVFDTEILGDKRRVQLSESSGSFCAQARPIAGIYVLSRTSSENGTVPDVAQLTPRQAVPSLLANCDRKDLLENFRRAHLLGSLATLAELIPVRRVRAADDLASLPLLIDALTSSIRQTPSMR